MKQVELFYTYFNKVVAKSNYVCIFLSCDKYKIFRFLKIFRPLTQNICSQIIHIEFYNSLVIAT